MNDYRILVVDDEEDLCEILKFNLENEGYEVDTANSAEEALRMDIGSYSLLLLDVMMGEISGFKMASVVLYIGNEKIQLEAETQKGTVKDDCAAECEGELRIGFNCEYLIDMISVCDSETITLEMSNAVSAVYVHDTGNTTYLVLPVRLK